jgi:alpha-tubulin suppressor-like RCC1 family protein
MTSMPIANLKPHIVFGYIIESALNLPNLVYQHEWEVEAQKIQVHFALSIFGEVFSWGRNSARWLGHGGDVPTTPKQIETLANYYVKEMKCSKPIEENNNLFFSVALTKDGKVFTWVSLHIVHFAYTKKKRSNFKRLILYITG